MTARTSVRRRLLRGGVTTGTAERTSGRRLRPTDACAAPAWTTTTAAPRPTLAAPAAVAPPAWTTIAGPRPTLAALAAVAPPAWTTIAAPRPTLAAASAAPGG